MHVRANGILRGDHIELDRRVNDLPNGSPVSVVLTPQEVPLDQKHRLIDELCGAWSDDPSLIPAFEQISELRRESVGRDVNLDDPS